MRHGGTRLVFSCHIYYILYSNFSIYYIIAVAIYYLAEKSCLASKEPLHKLLEASLAESAASTFEIHGFQCSDR